MNPYLSWAILLFVAGGLGFYYKGGSPPSRSNRTTLPKPPTEKHDNVSVNNKKLKRKPRKPQDALNGSGSSTPSATKQDVNTNTTATATASDATTSKDVARGEMDNYEFARQFSKVKDGNVMQVKRAKTKATLHTQKATTLPLNSSNNQGHEQHTSTSASSTTGADADDDLSPISSPTMMPEATAAGDISDMLEAPNAGPSVIRLTGSVEEQVSKKKTKQPFKAVETKKQRQQRIKRENSRQMVQEAESQRKSMLEKQLHTAREYERQEKSVSKDKLSTRNAWDSGAPAEKPNGVAATTAPLLDTFEPQSQSSLPAASALPTSSNITSTAESKPSTTRSSTTKNWTADLPSEEEQIRMLNSMNSENEWTTVSKRKKEKRKATISDAGSSESHIKDSSQQAA